MAKEIDPKIVKAMARAWLDATPQMFDCTGTTVASKATATKAVVGQLHGQWQKSDFFGLSEWPNDATVRATDLKPLSAKKVKPVMGDYENAGEWS